MLDHTVQFSVVHVYYGVQGRLKISV